MVLHALLTRSQRQRILGLRSDGGVRGALCGLTYLATLVSACNDQAGGVPSREVRGDTIVLTAPPPSLRIEATLDTLWRSDSLGVPVAVAAIRDGYVVAEESRLHFLTPSGEHTHSIGRSGDGPAEFRQIAGIAARQDTLFVLDLQLLRLTTLDVSGNYLNSRNQVTLHGYPNPTPDGRTLGFSGDAVLFAVEENVVFSRPTRRAVGWAHIADDSTVLLSAADHIAWKDANGIGVPTQAFGPRALIALGRNGRFAVSDGIGPCVRVFAVGQAGLTNICRAWERAAPSRQARNPDLEHVPSHQRDTYRTVIAAQEIGDLLPSIDRMVFDDVGRLWVRIVDEQLANVHPMMARFYPELLPTNHTWEILLETGMVEAAVVMPSDFDPVWIGDRDAVGFQTLESGEIAIARVAW